MQIRLSRNYTRTEEQRLSSTEEEKLTESALYIKLSIEKKRENAPYSSSESKDMSLLFQRVMMPYGNIK